MLQQGANAPAAPEGTHGQDGGAPGSDINLLFPSDFSVDGAALSGVVQIVSNGGNGGAGGTAADQQTGNGGNGGNGANSTNITASFADSRVTQLIINGTGPALLVSTTGGSGGAGGAAGTYGYGGTSGTGGTAGDITVNFGTSQTNVPATIDSKSGAPGIVLSSLGGSTGDAGWGTRAGLQSITGPSAGAAGSGGAISATINASVLGGITALSQGGSGGAGGQAISAWNAHGGNGGAGGAGGDIDSQSGRRKRNDNRRGDLWHRSDQPAGQLHESSAASHCHNVAGHGGDIGVESGWSGRKGRRRRRGVWLFK